MHPDQQGEERKGPFESAGEKHERTLKLKLGSEAAALIGKLLPRLPKLASKKMGRAEKKLAEQNVSRGEVT
jgi:hypothetical protein